ncbi:hypothetical protein ALTERO38_90029 [Alteromonas sp. 38]|nr:hypothetical protein ALTER154_10418 [Alteromonas sp. 154]VXC45428.1 hypothetical protein ALTERO38_90029 [Alteromonas sp. 38]
MDNVFSFTLPQLSEILAYSSGNLSIYDYNLVRVIDLLNSIVLLYE